jgi:ankyrin repeat protein
LIALTDTQCNTVLHQLAYEGHLDIIRLFVSRAKKYLLRKFGRKKSLFERDENQEITAWMNMQNSEGFTALLYATYNGHMDIIKYLMEDYAVNEKLCTKTGLNPLHLAAQKNMVLPFIYFKYRIGVNESDSNSSTALHWASYMNSEEVVAYLLTCSELTSLDE